MSGMIILFDVTNAESFNDMNKHLKLVEERCQLGRDKIILVGTKSDLIGQRKIFSDDLVQWAEEMNMIYIDVSNESGENVKDVFQVFAEQLILAQRRVENALQKGDKMSGEPENKSGGSCTIS